MSCKSVYFDHGATTFTRPEVLAEMLPYFGQSFGNPSSIYKLAKSSKYAIDASRKTVAECINAKEDEIYFSIIDYVTSKGDSEPKHYENEKTFASMQVFLLEEVEDDKLYNVYAWVVKEKHYLENGEIKKDSGSSIPHKFVVENIDGIFTVIDSRIPRDGSYYFDDMRNIFPNSVKDYMDNVHIDGTVERLQMEIEHQAKLYFQKQ